MDPKVIKAAKAQTDEKLKHLRRVLFESDDTKRSLKRIYVAGPYSGDNVIDIFDNIRNGIRMGLKVLLKGYAPFVPWLDFQFSLLLKENEKLTVPMFYEYSLSWLKVSDAMLVLPKWQFSKGTIKEIYWAGKWGIPVYYSLKELIENEDTQIKRDET